MSACYEFEIVPSGCPCQLTLKRVGSTSDCGHIALNLTGATVRTICDETGDPAGFHIQTPLGGVKISNTSPITLAQIQALICDCAAAGGGTAPGPDTPRTNDQSECLTCREL